MPDLRFGQFMMNVFGSMKRDPFFPEEDEMIRIIEDYAKTYGMPEKDSGNGADKPEGKAGTDEAGRNTVMDKIEDLREYADAVIHPLVSPDNYGVYSVLRDMIDAVGESASALMKESKAYNTKCSAKMHMRGGME